MLSNLPFQVYSIIVYNNTFILTLSEMLKLLTDTLRCNFTIDANMITLMLTKYLFWTESHYFILVAGGFTYLLVTDMLLFNDIPPW